MIRDRRTRSGAVMTLVGAAAVVALTLLAASQPAAARRSGSGYGLQGGVSDELALANVKSGLYGLRYTYDRAHYDFRGCPDPREAAIGYSPVCPPPRFQYW